MTSAILSATDVDDAAASLVFTVGSVTHGRFELLGVPGRRSRRFTQDDILAGPGAVRARRLGRRAFLHAHCFGRRRHERSLPRERHLHCGRRHAGRWFRQRRRWHRHRRSRRSRRRRRPTDRLRLHHARASLSVRPDVLPYPTLPLVYGVAQEYLRTPVGPVISVNEEETGGAQATTAAPVVEQPGKPVQPPASNAAPEETGVKETTALPPIHAAPDVLATAPSNASVDVTPLRAEMDTIQTRKAAVVQSAKQQRSMLSNALWISGAAASRRCDRLDRTRDRIDATAARACARVAPRRGRAHSSAGRGRAAAHGNQRDRRAASPVEGTPEVVRMSVRMRRRRTAPASALQAECAKSHAAAPGS